MEIPSCAEGWIAICSREVTTEGNFLDHGILFRLLSYLILTLFAVVAKVSVAINCGWVC